MAGMIEAGKLLWTGSHTRFPSLPARSQRPAWRWRTRSAGLAVALLFAAVFPLPGLEIVDVVLLGAAGLAVLAVLDVLATNRRLRATLGASRRIGARDRRQLHALVSELQRREQELRCAKDMAERAGRSKAEFLRIISHEIRTPLNGVLGPIALLADTRLTAEQQALLGAVQDSGSVLLGILGTIHDFTHLEDGGLTLERTAIDLGAQLTDLDRSFRPRAAARGLELTMEVASTVPRHLIGDGRRLRQMLDTLVDNALKFTDRGGITIAITGTPQADRTTVALRVDVTDTGIGVPADRRAEVFADLTQLDRSYARRFSGTGLGLAVTRRLVGLMGGRIAVDAGPDGCGSRFTLELPLEIRQAAAPAPVAAPVGEPALRRALARRGAPARILVAEDTPTNQLIIRAMLEKAGCRVHVVSCGADAVAAVEAHTWDLVLMDIAMPGMDGLEATRRIRALPGARRRVPIIAVTANLAGEERETYLAAGMNDCLLKPFRAHDLLTLVARALAPTAAAASDGADPAPSAGSDSAPLVDAATLEALGGEIDADALSGILVTFAQDVQNRLARIAAAADTANLRTIAFESHAVSSCSCTFGALRLARACRDIEHAVEDGDDREVLALARSLSGIGKETLSALSSYRSAA